VDSIKYEKLLTKEEGERNMIRTSIIIPTHNDKDCVGECIDGIIRNTDNYEIIFVLDDSVEFKEELKRYGKVVETRQPFTFSSRINLGIAAAQGKYFCILNDDTVPQPGWLENMIHDSREYGYALTGARCQKFGCHNADAHGIGPVVETQHTINMFAALIPRRLHDIVGPLDERFVRYGGDDDDYYVRARRHGFATIISSGFVLHKKSRAFGMERITNELPETRHIFKEKWGVFMPVSLDQNWSDEDHRDAIEPIVSVIMPTRGHHKYIREAVISVLAQGYKKLELLVGIDGPDQEETVKSLEGIEDPRLKVEAFPEHEGSCAVRNRLILHCKGDFVALMDSDDMMLPDRIEEQLRAMDPWTDIVHTAFLMENAAGKVTTHDALPINREMLLSLTSYVAGGTMMLRRRILVSDQFTRKHERAFDFEFALRTHDKYVYKFLPKPSIIYRRHAGSHLSGTTESRMVHFDVINEYTGRTA
jgi:glycosyltransferase involved in cell wall biosynthesis